MGCKENRSEEKEEQNAITLEQNGIKNFLKEKLKNFKNQETIINILSIYMESGENNKISEPYIWTRSKDKKYSEKGVELFSCELNCISNNKFRLNYYFYYGYYLQYNNFHFLDAKKEKDFNEIVANIDANSKEKEKIKLSVSTTENENENENDFSEPLINP